MTTLTTNDVRLINQRDNDKLYPIPDYTTDPAAWEYRMREIAHGCAKRRGWMDTYTRTAFVKDEVLKVCAAKHKLGDTRWFLRILSQQLKARGYGNQNHKTRIIKNLYRYAEALGLSEADAQGIIERHAKSIQLNENAVMTAIRSAATKQGTLIPEPPRVKATSPFGQPLNRNAAELETERQRGLAAIQKLQEQAMTNQPTAPASDLDLALGRGKGEPPAEDKPVHWIDDPKACKTFWATVTPWIKWSGYEGEAKDFVHSEVGKIHDWMDGYDPLVERITKTAIVRKMEAGLKRELTGDDFFNATDYKSLRSAMAGGVSDGNIRDRIDEFLASAKSEPRTGQNSSAGNIPQEPPAKPMAGKSEPQNEAISDDGQTAPQKTSHAWGFAPTPFLTEVITLTGCPVGELYVWLNKRHNAKYYKSIDARDGSDEKWTDLDPVAVRKRFDKVFGPQGFGWRILPLDNAVVTWQTDSFVTRAGKEKQVKTATASMFVFEYVLVVNGQMQWFRTSAFSDSSTNMSNDAGDALRGVSTSLMKQALKMFGGYDHFIDKAA